jgi:hypothetical protein
MAAFPQLVAVLGEYEDSTALRRLLIGVGDQLQPQRDDTQLSFISFHRLGISFAYEDEATLLRKEQPIGGRSLLAAIHLYSEGFEKFDEFKGELPSHLSFKDSRDDVRLKLGSPSESGGGKRALGRLWPRWDRYDYETHSFGVQYSDDLNRVDMITLIAPVKVKALARGKV